MAELDTRKRKYLVERFGKFPGIKVYEDAAEAANGEAKAGEGKLGDQLVS